MRYFLLIILLAVFTSGKAQVVTRYVDPDKTRQGINAVHGPHVAMYDPHRLPGEKLLVFIVGTNGKATDAMPMCTYFAGLGYNTISIDYRNTVITTTCTKSEDSTCFDHFRREILFGTPVSDSVNVDSTNSILNRLQQLVTYLAANDKGGHWQNFIDKGSIRWSKVSVGGHSQGAGHAAFIGQNFRVKRVLIFSGPQDYLSVFNQPAGWLSNKSKTPLSRYYAFLHRKDPFNMSWQLACDQKILRKNSQPLQVQPGVYPEVHTSIFGTREHIFVNDIDTKNAHGSTVMLQFTPVWDAMAGW